MDRFCIWEYDEPNDKWDTDCGKEFHMKDYTPEDNEAKTCCYCGKERVTVRQVPCEEIGVKE